MPRSSCGRCMPLLQRLNRHRLYYGSRGVGASPKCAESGQAPANALHKSFGETLRMDRCEFTGGYVAPMIRCPMGKQIALTESCQKTATYRIRRSAEMAA